MLTKLRLKNWRSVKDETIDFTPITVFIGANSSGKTNILDALRFLQYSGTEGNRGLVGAILYNPRWGGRDKIRTIGVPEHEPTDIEFSFQPRPDAELLTRTSSMRFLQTDSPLLEYKSRLTYGTETVDDPEPVELPLRANYSQTSAFTANDSAYAIKAFVDTYITRRWQIFDELVKPNLSLPSNVRGPGDLYVVDEDAENIPYMLDYMRSQHPDLYEKLQDDIFWLLNHINRLEMKHTERELSVIVREKAHKGLEAPSISAGTRRLIAMLTAVYALDMDNSRVQSMSFGFQPSPEWNIPIKDMPGLVVIEEPDTALNPGILRNFVEQLRVYTEGDHPRQFILTTHNPRFLDYFKPEEVRVVSRDEQGYTTVSGIPKHIPEVWLEDGYTLGEVWMTHSLGGLPE